MIGLAIGNVGISYDDFLRLDCDAFFAILKAHSESEERKQRDEWERMRMLATITIQPHLSKNAHITPEKLLPFSWDHANDSNQTPKMSAKEQREHMRKLAESIGDEMI